MAEKNKEVVALNEEQLKQKEADLNEREETLNSKENELTEKEETLNSKEEELSKKETELNELEEELLKSDGSAAEVEELIPGLDFTLDKEKFKFKDSSPKNLRVGGKTLSQKEIVKDKDLLQKLVKGPHIEKIK